MIGRVKSDKGKYQKAAILPNTCIRVADVQSRKLATSPIRI